MADGVSSIGSSAVSSIGMHRPSLAAASGRSGGATPSIVPQSPELQQQVQKLRQTDASVRQHEAAHQSAGGGHAGAASFTYTRGPDGKSYAIAGEVPVDASAESEPSATIAKMERVKAAALAPSDPSPQDLRVAAQADAQKIRAESEQRRPEQGYQGGNAPTGAPALAARGASAYAAAQSLGAPRAAGIGAGIGLTV